MKRAKITKGNYNDKYVGYAFEVTRFLEGLKEYLGCIYKDGEYYGETIIAEHKLEWLKKKDFDELTRDKTKEEEEEKVRLAYEKAMKERLENTSLLDITDR